MTSRSNHDLSDDLQLEAVEYLLGGLDEARTAAFEERLLEDQNAREALEFASCIEMAAQHEPARAARPWARLRVAGAAAAALLVVVLGGRAFDERSTPLPSTPQPEAEELEEVLATWVSLGAPMEEFADDEAELLVAEEDEPVPGWLMEGDGR